MVAIVDYGVGNLHSIHSALTFLGQNAVVTGNAEEILSADRVILPGVGAFGDAVDKLRNTGLDVPLCAVAKRGTPLLGICLGMQLLFEKSEEFGWHRGLGLVPGRVCALAGDIAANYKVPHMGWNVLQYVQANSPMLRRCNEGDYVYYVHSFYATACDAFVVATSDYGVDVPGIVQNANVFGTQFHPEKSGKVGLAILQSFIDYQA